VLDDDRLTPRQVLDAIPARLKEKGRYRHGVLEKVILVDDENRPTRVVEFFDLWRNQDARQKRVAIVGLGYVGLTLAVALAEAGISVVGVDNEADVIQLLGQGSPHIHEAGLEPLLRHHLGVNLSLTVDVPDDADVYVLSVPTPLGADQQANLTFLRSAAASVGRHLAYGDLVAIRSTVPLGTTRSIVRPILEEASGLQCGRDFSLAFAPERTIAGRAIAELRSLPQIVGGFDQHAVDVTASLFRELTPSIITMPSLEEAEMVKLLNNTFRDLTFAFANEVAGICEHYALDANRVIRAANDGYPRSRIPFPSPGVGGSCLTKDPYMLADAARQAGLPSSLALLGRQVNEEMPARLVRRICEALQRLGKNPGECRFFILGFAFKGEPETSDMRHSPTLDVLSLLVPLAGEIRGYDPVVTPERIAALGVRPCSIEEGFRDADCAIVMTNHRDFAALDVYACLERMNRPAVCCDWWEMLSPERLRTVDGITCLAASATL
jgi:nucleotide sugar dehydrogenase